MSYFTKVNFFSMSMWASFDMVLKQFKSILNIVGGALISVVALTRQNIVYKKKWIDLVANFLIV